MTSEEVAGRIRQSSVAIRGSDSGAGSGVIWSADGLIVTNAHVVRSREPIVILRDRSDRKQELKADILGHNQERDLALLQVHAVDLIPAIPGDSDGLRIGQLVMAIGNPLGIAGAVTTGIIYSAGDRGWIEASVRLAPGNSGGILADSEGRVIGINTMIRYGLALAIPSNTAAAFVQNAIRSGKQSRRTRAA